MTIVYPDRDAYSKPPVKNPVAIPQDAATQARRGYWEEVLADGTLSGTVYYWGPKWDTLYSNGKSGSNNPYAGWSPEGKTRFNQLVKINRDARTKAATRAMEKIVLAEVVVNRNRKRKPTRDRAPNDDQEAVDDGEDVDHYPDGLDADWLAEFAPRNPPPPPPGAGGAGNPLNVDV